MGGAQVNDLISKLEEEEKRCELAETKMAEISVDNLKVNRKLSKSRALLTDFQVGLVCALQ